MIIRPITLDDADHIHKIYAPIVRDTVISFEEVVPNVLEIEQRIVEIARRYPWLVAEDVQGDIMGYAYACQHRTRHAYQWSVETSIYLNPGYKRRGVGKQLYQKLFAELRQRGFYNAYAGITVPNEESCGFHRSMGFSDIGLYPKIGYKFGAWHDVLWLKLDLQAKTNQVAPPNFGFLKL